jgi:hypothetical protein
MVDPILMLYVFLLLTSATAAFAAREVGHEMLAHRYVANSPIYAMLGLCHCLRF